MSDEYLLGVSDEELARLGFQHQMWGASTSALWDRAGFGRGQRIVDLGAGPGFASIDLARRVGPEGSIIAIDSSDKAIASLRARAGVEGLDIDARVADVSTLEMPADLDGIFARWLFCFLPNPRDVVRRAAGALRPGGRIAILDYFNYAGLALAPKVDVFPELVRAVQESWAAHGGSLDVAGSLPTWLGEAGLHVDCIEPIVHCARPGDPIWHWPMTFFATYLDVLVERGHLSTTDADEVRRAFEGHAKNPNAFLLTPPVLAIVATRR